MFVEIGALVQKECGQRALEALKDEEGVKSITVESGRSADLFEDRQFGTYGEAAIVTIIADNDAKEAIFNKLYHVCELHDKKQGLVFMSEEIIKSSVSSAPTNQTGV
jgi:hypothetical protein